MYVILYHEKNLTNGGEKFVNEKQLKLNQSVEKAFVLIELMANHNQSMRLQEIAKQAGIPQPTALRILYTLMKLGYIMQDEDTLKYSLSLKFSLIGAQVASQIDLRDIVKPYLNDISRRCGEANCLSIREGRELLYIDNVDGRDSLLTVTQKIGKRAPLYCTAAGKQYLTQMSREELKRFIFENPLRRLTEHTIITYGELCKELDLIREQGYSLDNEECELGVRCIAVPIRNFHDEIIATISVSGPIARMDEEKMVFINEVLAEYVSKIEVTMARSKP